VRKIDALDGSITSLAIASKLAIDEGLQSRIRYFAADFNAPAFPDRTYDLVLFQESAHHVLRLEKLFHAVLRALKPDGLVYMDEYVGPSRFEWNDDMMVPYRRIYESIDPELRAVAKLDCPVMVPIRPRPYAPAKSSHYCTSDSRSHNAVRTAETFSA
jgi:SAM-dependent methyltransferase